MIFDAPGDDWLAIEIGQDAAQIMMQFIAEHRVAQKWPTFFGGKNRVDQNFCQ